MDASGGRDAVLHKLADGGYHRAHNTALSVFDRIAGGLAWAILSARHRLCVGLVKNADIREKIRVSEAICDALKRMRCPMDLRPHQVQGLDFPCLLRVVVWLLRCVEAVRAENALLLERHTAWDFFRRFGSQLPFLLPQQQQQEAEVVVVGSRASPADVVLHVSRSRLAPTRQFIPVERPPRDRHESRLAHVSSVLLEYGVRYATRNSVLLLQHTAKEAGALEGEDNDIDLTRLKEEEDQEGHMLEGLMQQMRQHRERKDGKMPRARVHAVLQATEASDEEQRLRAAYNVRQEEMRKRQEEAQAVWARLERKQRAAARYRHESEALQQRCVEAEQQLAETQAVLQAAKEKSARRTAKLAAYVQNVHEVHQHVLADPSRAAVLQTLMDLLQKREEQHLLLEQAQRDGKCRVKMAKAECVSIDDRISNVKSGVVDDTWETERAHYAAQLQQKEVELAAVEQQALDLLRCTDAYPTRSELEQIGMRIRELNEEVACRYEEAKAAFSRHNTQAEILKCLESEASIMAQLDGKTEACLQQPVEKARARCKEVLGEHAQVLSQLHSSLELVLRQKDDVAMRLGAARKEYDALLGQRQHHRDLLEMLERVLREQPPPAE